MTEEDRKKALKKAEKVKTGKTMTGQNPDVIEMILSRKILQDKAKV